MKTVWSKDALKAYFNEWAVISFEEAGNPTKQEAEVNRFFNTLKNQGLYKDLKGMQKFCKTMVELSVERALFLSDGMSKRPADRLVYRYIESFLNFLVVSLMNFTSQADGMSKHEFLTQVLDAVFQVLDEDHRSRKGEFNQKPYYRILINILRIVSNTQTFNNRVQHQVFSNLAEIFIKLSPKDYPAFAFAWLELISHRLFMPYFLAVP
jgi:CCR4-NOT transcription complex subunit 1